MKHNIESIRVFGEKVMQKVGMSERDARIFLDNMIQSDLRGVRSHGVANLAGYVMRIERGCTSATAQPEVISEKSASFVVDAKCGMGPTTAVFTIEKCMQKAKDTGVCFATVRNASHYGFGGYYVMKASEQNQIGFAICDTACLVAPFGGADPFLGTNPLSIAIPSKRHPDLVLDMATSVVAKGKIALAMKEGKSIPDTWALDIDGNPTTDPKKANVGALLPFGGPKGYGISLIIEVICCCLAGANSSRQIPRNFEDPKGPSGIGYMMGVIDIESFIETDAFIDRIDTLFDDLKSGKPAAGFSEIMIPGEIEHRQTLKGMEEGIELSEVIIKDFKTLSERYDVAWGE